MYLPEHEVPKWLQSIDFSRIANGLAKPPPSLSFALAAFRASLPRDYCDFLEFSDGGTIEVANGPFELYPIRECLEVNLRALNPDAWAVFAIAGIEFGDEAGFLKTQLQAHQQSLSVYAFYHESGEVALLENSFADLISRLCALRPDEWYHPLWERQLEEGPAPQKPVKPWWRIWS